MRKIIVLSFITLDGVMQAPGGPNEDESGGFKFGGWLAPFFDDEAGEIMSEQMLPAEYLLGRKTFNIFEQYWPKPEHANFWPGINNNMKYVVSETRIGTDWEHATFLKTIDDVKQLKKSEGEDLHVHGSGKLVQALLENDLVDELWLKTFPLTLGSGKKLFAEGAIPATFTLINCKVTNRGVIFANYERAGGVVTATVGE